MDTSQHQTTTMSGKVYFISGANRGIGFQLTKQLSEDPSNTVIGSARDISKANELQALVDSNKNVHIVSLDVSDLSSIEKLDSQLKDIAKDGIDVLFSNAGISRSTKPAIKTDIEVYESHLKTNTLGPIFLTRALYKYFKLKDTKHLIYISSIAGSISSQINISTSAYGLSKAALNYFTKELSLELESEGFVSVAAHPGTVETDMLKNGLAIAEKESPEIADLVKAFPKLTPEESARHLIDDVALKLTKDHNGKFLNYDGQELPY